ncbi:hypothetical protein FQZ97_833310 [compost metagenome]
MPDLDVEVFQSGFGQGWRVLQHRERQPLQAGDAVDLDLLPLDLRHRVGRLFAHHIDLSADEVRHGRRGPFVGHGRHARLQRALEHQAAQVRCGTEPRVGEVHLAAVRRDPLTQLREVACSEAWLANQHRGRFVDHTQGFEIVRYLVAELAVQGRRGGHADVMHQQRVAVRCGARHFGRAHRAARASGVFDDDGLAQRLAKRLGQVPGDLVAGPAGGKRHDQRDGFVRKLGACQRSESEHGEAGAAAPKMGHGFVSLGFGASGRQRLHLAVQVGLAFEADAGQVRQRHMAVLDLHAIGESAERLEQVGVGLVAAQPEPRGDVQ